MPVRYLLDRKSTTVVSAEEDIGQRQDLRHTPVTGKNSLSLMSLMSL